MQPHNDLVERMTAFYRVWEESRGHCPEELAALLADEVHVASMDHAQPGLGFADIRSVGREAAIAYFHGIQGEWEMLHYTPDQIFADGDRVAMFGTTSHRHKGTGKIADTRIANFWRFRDGRAVEFIDIFDSARAVAAATPD